MISLSLLPRPHQLSKNSILGSVLHVFGHTFQCWDSPNNEHKARPQLDASAPSQSEAGIHRTGIVLRLLCHFRLSLEPDHDKVEPSGMDEQDSHRCWNYWGLHGCNEGSLEFIVSMLCFLQSIKLKCLSLLRLLLGVIIAGMWPGMAYYLTLFYPPSRTGKRIGQYFTAAQVSAAVVGLVSAGFQKMDGLGGLVGFQWMFLLYGIVGILVGVSLLWWLPDRPLPPGEVRQRTGLMRWLPESPPALSGEDARIHYQDLTRVYHRRVWTIKDLGRVLIDWRLWPLTLMYFGVVGVGIGVQNYGTVIIQGTNPNLTGIQLSLLFAPIWIVSSYSAIGL